MMMILTDVRRFPDNPGRKGSGNLMISDKVVELSVEEWRKSKIYCRALEGAGTVVCLI